MLLEFLVFDEFLVAIGKELCFYAFFIETSHVTEPVSWAGPEKANLSQLLFHNVGTVCSSIAVWVHAAVPSSTKTVGVVLRELLLSTLLAVLELVEDREVRFVFQDVVKLLKVSNHLECFSVLDVQSKDHFRFLGFVSIIEDHQSRGNLQRIISNEVD